MEITEKLDLLLEKASKDQNLKENLLATVKSSNPLSDFCRIASENGISISVMDIVNQGEEFYAEIKRSTTAEARTPRIWTFRTMNTPYS